MSHHTIRRLGRVLLLSMLSIFITITLFFFWSSSGQVPPQELSTSQLWPNEVKDQTENQGIFKIMTYNIGYLSGLANNLPVRRNRAFFEANLHQFQQRLAEVSPDFIALQEVDFQARRSHFQNQYLAIARAGGFSYGTRAVNWDKRYVPFPYWPPKVHFGKIVSGQAFLSRYTIVNSERVVLPKIRKRPFFYRAYYLDRLAQVISLEVNGRPLLVFNLHLEAFEKETRIRQAHSVLELYHRLGKAKPVIILGDFNCVPPDAPIKKGFDDDPEADYRDDPTIDLFYNEESLSEAFLDANKRYPNSNTFQSSAPNRKLDYLFYTHSTIECLHARVIKVLSSDHLPILMEFRFRTGEEE